MNDIYLLDCSVLDDDSVFYKYYNLMSAYRKNKIDRLIPRKSKNLSLGAGILLDYYLRQHKLQEKEMVYSFNQSEKPYFSNYPNLHFNLSHSGNIAICVFSDKEVGCDIEQIDKPLEDVAKRFFTENEYRYIFKNTLDSEKAERFYRIWTLKESYLKLTGKGLSGGLDSFSIKINNENNVLVEKNSNQNICKDNVSTDTVFFKEYDFKNYKIAVCSNCNNFSPSIVQVSI
ncbi:MAG: 4'-phosphopantetheinyl transferase superfamily protein [Acutalibacteraceae bacterium]|nr:4'-phosphopantetheinyl transferase superfamily protein [Acutalibacteraceae bacterium]